jgi:16S rRNA (adenine1518-N6/adenine1519-N6)-dimethyltransferase
VEVLESILAEAGPTPGGRILEIGPGLGILTRALLAAGASVTAVELDAGLAAFLRVQLAESIDRDPGLQADTPGTPESRDVPTTPGAPEPPGALRLIEGDALDLDLVHLVPPPYDVVANLPYHITSPILHRLLGQAPRPARLVLMLQREVAARIAAPPGKMSYLSVFVQYHARVRIARIVPPAAFEPAPRVDSAVVVLEPYSEDDRLQVPATEDELWRVVQAGFRERRKMLHNVLARQLPVSADRVMAALAAAGIAPDRRPQTLAVGEWLRLRETLGPIEPWPAARNAREEGSR